MNNMENMIKLEKNHRKRIRLLTIKRCVICKKVISKEEMIKISIYDIIQPAHFCSFDCLKKYCDEITKNKSE